MLEHMIIHIFVNSAVLKLFFINFIVGLLLLLLCCYSVLLHVFIYCNLFIVTFIVILCMFLFLILNLCGLDWSRFPSELHIKPKVKRKKAKVQPTPSKPGTKRANIDASKVLEVFD